MSSTTLFLERIKAGDEQAATELFKMYGPKIEMIVHYRIPDEIEAEDVIQDIWNAILQSLKTGKFNPDKGKSLSSYILGIVNNKILYWNHKKRFVSAKTLQEQDLVAEEIDTIEEAEKRKQIMDIIALLPPKYQEVLYLRFFEELTIVETSEKLHLSPQRVMEMIHYALVKMRKELRVQQSKAEGKK